MRNDSAMCNFTHGRAIGMRTSNMTPRAITVKEAAIYLSTTVPAIRQLIYSRQIPFVRVGKRFVMDVKDLDAWLERMKYVAE